MSVYIFNTLLDNSSNKYMETNHVLKVYVDTHYKDAKVFFTTGRHKFVNSSPCRIFIPLYEKSLWTRNEIINFRLDLNRIDRIYYLFLDYNNEAPYDYRFWEEILVGRINTL